MKTSDFLVLGGIGVLGYLLLSKPKGAEANGVSIISIPTPGEAPGVAGILESLKGLIGQAPSIITMPSAEAPLDVGNIFAGMASMFSGVLGAMPSLGEQGPSEWDMMQAFEDWLGRMGFGPGEQGPSEWDLEAWLTKTFGFTGEGTPANGKSLWDSTKEAIVTNIVGPVTEKTGAGAGSVAETFWEKTGAGAGSVVDTFWEGVEGFTGFMGQPFNPEYWPITQLVDFFTGGKEKDIPEAFVKESEATFEKAGITEAGSMADIKALAAARASIAGRGREEKQTDVSLITLIPSLRPGQIARQHWE